MADQDASGPVGRVLIVDGHEQDRRALAALLGASSFDVAVAKCAREARGLLGAGPVDAVVVDPELEDDDGLALVRALADQTDAAIFVVAAGADDRAVERAYAAGAHDFACKPIVVSEWVARLRRATEGRGGAGNTSGPRLALNRQERSCVLDGRTHQLTRHERDFLACLLDAPNHFASYERLIAAVWGDDRAVETQYLRVLAAQVRRKLESGRNQAPLIHTVVGEGLKLNL